MDYAATKPGDKAIAGVSTAVLIGLLIFIAFYITFITPIPPFEESKNEGIEVNLGFADEGMGDDFSDVPYNPSNPLPDKSNPNQSNSSPQNNQLTADDPTNPPVKNNPNPPKNTQNPDKSVLDAFKNFSNNDPTNPNSDGDGDKPNNQGKPDGTNTPNYDGPGGKGFKWNLKGRALKSPPEKITNFEEEGQIVVDIVVDKNGKVIYAEANRAKSINPNYMLCAKARQAAFTTQFSPSPDGTIEQKGTITFVFTLK
jgi:TonB family protein